MFEAEYTHSQLVLYEMEFILLDGIRLADKRLLSAGSVYNTQHAHVPTDTSDMNAIVTIVEYVTSYIICFII